jgi:predicted esterase
MVVRAWIGVGVAGLALVGCGGEVVTSDDAGVPVDDAAITVSDDAFVASTPDAGPSDAGPLRMDPTLPTAAGTCPDMSASGMVTVEPEGIATRQARIWVGDEAAASDGPLVFFWHGAGGSPNEAPYALGDAIDEITAAGGIVIAPVHDAAAGTFPWFLTAGGTREDDLLVADELLACAESSIGIDDHHVHVVGFSAGALHTTQMGFRRASYVASFVAYSGGLIMPRAPRTDAADARFSAMLLFGGERDEVVINFATATRNLQSVLEARGDFSFVCDHGMGHTVPSAAIPSAWRFLQDHPYGMHPAAYEAGLPDGFYAACEP